MKVVIYSVDGKGNTERVFESDVEGVFTEYKCSITQVCDLTIITVFENITVRSRPLYKGAIDIVKVV